MPNKVGGTGNEAKDSTAINPSKSTLGGEDYKFFNTSWQALVKTSTMFSGEFVSIRICANYNILQSIILLNLAFCR